MIDAQRIGTFIRTERKKKQLKQADLANLLHISPAAVSKWEKGVNVPDTANLEELARILNVSISELLKGGLNTAQSTQEPNAIAADVENPDAATEASTTTSSITEALAIDISGIAESDPALALPAPKTKRKIQRKLIAIAISVSLVLLLGCVGIIVIHNYSSAPVFTKVAEFYGPFEDLSLDNVCYVIFESDKNNVADNDYDEHFESLKKEYDASAFEKCDALVFLYFNHYNTETDSIDTAKYKAVLFPVFYEYAIP